MAGTSEVPNRAGDGPIEVVFDGPVDLTPEAAKVLLGILRRRIADKQAVEGVSPRPVSPSTTGPAAIADDGVASPDGPNRCVPPSRPRRNGTAIHPTPSAGDGET
jgi:hypothetical protein